MKYLSFFFTLSYFLFFHSTLVAQSKLLDEEHIRKNGKYTSIKEALENPKRVYWLEFSSSDPITSDIGKLTRVQWLKIKDYKNLSLPAEITKLTNLEYLEIDNVDLQSLPAGFSNMKHLKEVIIRSYTLPVFPAEFLQCPNLEKFKVEFRGKEFPATVINCKKLKVFSVKAITNKKFPSYLGELTQLEELNLKGTDLDTIPEFVFKLVNLKKLTLSYEDYRFIPEEISKLQQLESLDLTYNNLTTVPDYVLKLPKLKFLDVAYNNIVQKPHYKKFNPALFVDDTYNPRDMNKAAEEAGTSGDFKTMRKLVEQGATFGKSIIYAAKEGDLETVQFLIDHDADVNVIGYRSRFLQRSWELTALDQAMENDHYDVAQLLVDYGADVNANINGRSLLHWAISINAMDEVKFLTENGANIFENQGKYDDIVNDADSSDVKSYILHARTQAKIYPKAPKMRFKPNAGRMYYAHKIEGTLRDARTHSPIKREMIVLKRSHGENFYNRDWDLADITDENGHFEFVIEGFSLTELDSMKFDVVVNEHDFDQKYRYTKFKDLHISPNENLLLEVKGEQGIKRVGKDIKDNFEPGYGLFPQIGMHLEKQFMGEVGVYTTWPSRRDNFQRGNAPTTFSSPYFNLSTEFNFSKNFILGPKLGIRYQWAFFEFGSEFISYTNFDQWMMTARPQVGISGLGRWTLLYGRNIKFNNNDLHHQISKHCFTFIIRFGKNDDEF